MWGTPSAKEAVASTGHNNKPPSNSAEGRSDTQPSNGGLEVCPTHLFMFSNAQITMIQQRQVRKSAP